MIFDPVGMVNPVAAAFAEVGRVTRSLPASSFGSVEGFGSAELVAGAAGFAAAASPNWCAAPPELLVR